MSVDATRWAWEVEVSSATKRLVLLALADRAGEEHTCYPSAVRMALDTSLDRKTILNAITDLIADGLVIDTGRRKGTGVRVLQLNGVPSREERGYQKRGSDTKTGTSTKIGTDTKIGMPSSTEIGMPSSTNIGIQNLKGNLKENLKDLKDIRVDCVGLVHPIIEIFEFWKTVFKKNNSTRLEGIRERKIKARLKDGRTVEEIKTAIVNCSKSDYHVSNGYTDLELICRDDVKFEGFLNMKPKPQYQGSYQQQQDPAMNRMDNLRKLAEEYDNGKEFNYFDN